MDSSYLNRWASLTVPVDYADPGRRSHYDLIDSLEGKRSERREVDVDDAAFVIGCSDSVSSALAAQSHLLEDAAPSPLVIATDADPSTLHSGGVAIARAVDPSANLPGGQAC